MNLPERLKGLPAFEPPPGGWARLVDRMERRPPRRSRALAPLALAASLLAGIGIALLLPSTTPPATAPAADQLAQLMQQSQVLERRLEQVRPEVAVWNGTLEATADQLRDQVAMVDLQLSWSAGAKPAAVRRLWQNRVALMTRLVQTHQDASLAPRPDSPQEQML